MLGSEFGVCNKPTDWRASEAAGCCPWPEATDCSVPVSWLCLIWPADKEERLDFRLSPFRRKWHWMWVLRWPEVRKRRSQKGHLKGLEPVWRRMCTFRLPFVEKEVLHMWQLNSFWPATIIQIIICFIVWIWIAPQSQLRPEGHNMKKLVFNLICTVWTNSYFTLILLKTKDSFEITRTACLVKRACCSPNVLELAPGSYRGFCILKHGFTSKVYVNNFSQTQRRIRDIWKLIKQPEIINKYYTFAIFGVWCYLRVQISRNRQIPVAHQ